MANRIVTGILLLLGAVSIAISVRGITAAGIGWDAGIDTLGAIQTRQVTPEMTLAQAYESVYFTSEFYGVLVQTIADWLHQLATGTTEFLSPDARETFIWQASVNVGIAILGSAALAVAVGRVLRSALAGAFTWALLWTMPLFAGMSHVDYKDMPIAAGLTLVSAAMMLVLHQGRSRADFVVGLVFGSLGASIAIGQRVGAWPLVLALLGGCLAVVCLQAWRHRDWRLLAIPTVTAGVSVAVSLLVLWLMNPIARINLWQWLADAFAVSREYPWDGFTRTAGTDAWSLDLPWWYAPAWLAAQLPIVTGLAVLAGALAILWALFRPTRGLSRTSVVAYTPVLIQGIVLPAVVVLSGATLYNGLRHLLFIVPAAAAIAAFWVPALEHGAQRSLGRMSILAVATLVPVAAGLVAVVQWAPYAYAYVNEVAANRYPQRDWELDYWGVTAMEGVQRLQSAGQTRIAVFPSDFTSKIVGGTTPEALAAENLREFGFYQFIVGDVKPLPPGCSRAFAIERGGMLLGEGAICRR